MSTLSYEPNGKIINLKTLVEQYPQQHPYQTILEKFFSQNQPLDMLEIGVYKASFITRLQTFNLKIASYTGVDPYLGTDDDPYKNSYWKKDPIEAVYSASAACFKKYGATLLRKTSDDFFRDNQQKFDFIFVDGDHRRDPALRDFNNAKKALKPGGLLMINDYANVDCPDVTAAVNLFLKSHFDEVDYIGYNELYFKNEGKVIPVSLVDIFIQFKGSTVELEEFRNRLLRLLPHYQCGFPRRQTQVALVMWEKDLSSIPALVKEQQHCNFKFIALADKKPESPNLLNAAGLKAPIPVGELTDLAIYPHLDYVVYAADSEIGAYLKIVHLLQMALGAAVPYWLAPDNAGLNVDIARLSPTLYEHHQYQLSQVHAILADESSQEIFARVVKSRTTNNPGYYRRSDYPEYFHPALPIKAGDVIFDAGVAEIAWPTSRFSELIGPNGRVYGFEPDPFGYGEATKKLKPRPNVTLWPKGLWHEEALLPFKQRGQGSGVASVKSAGAIDIINVPLTTIDLTVKEHNIERLDLIKMGIEGAEMSALKGAVETLKRFKPNLAVCLYHLDSDLFEIPLFINNLNLGYKIYIGHHSPTKLDTVLYATAREIVDLD